MPRIGRIGAPRERLGRSFPPWLAVWLLVWLSLPVLAAQGAAAPETPADEDPETPRIVLLSVESAIHAVVTDRVREAIDRAESSGAQALVLQLDTPGGSLEATRQIVKALLGSRVPVVVWIGPAGSRAASAGFVILLAADLAAMAPGTNTGAAHPVAQGGQDIPGDMGQKVEQDLLALVRSLATQGERDLELAQSAVVESSAFTAEEAFEVGLVDALAPDLATLMTEIDGRQVRRDMVAGRSLETDGATLVEEEMGRIQSLLAALAHPQIAGLLMALGMLGLYAEISNPGAFVPGILGAICLILAFYSLSVLPINYAGLALVALALVLFVGELIVPTFGALTLGGTLSMVLGLLMMFRDAGPAFEMPTGTLVVLGAIVFGGVFLTSRQTLAMRKKKVTTGREGLIGERGEARSEVVSEAAPGGRGTGKVWVHGELWRAVSDSGESIRPGAAVEVVDVEGLTLRVASLASTKSAPTSAAPEVNDPIRSETQ